MPLENDKFPFDFDQIDPSGEIMVLSTGGCPWKDHLLTLEEELDTISAQVKFVLYTDQNEKWRVQCVPVHKNTFENRYLDFQSNITRAFRIFCMILDLNGNSSIKQTAQDFYKVTDMPTGITSNQELS